jgi:cytochrome c oxidase subunit 2
MIEVLALLLFGPPVEIQVVAKQWAWKFQHLQGRREINELHVPVGYPVELRMTSEDVPHALAIPAFRLKQFLFRGRETRLTFVAKRKGEFDFLCAARCGAYNSKMRGKVIVMEMRDYLQWARGEVPGESTLATGRRLYASLKCETCHRPDGAGRGPGLGAVFGRTVTLRDGRTVLADEEYVRESILDPSAKVVIGYEPVMPSFQGQLSEGQVRALLTFLKTLEGGSP